MLRTLKILTSPELRIALKFWCTEHFQQYTKYCIHDESMVTVAI